MPGFDQRPGKIGDFGLAADNVAQHRRPGHAGRLRADRITLDLADAGLHLRDKFVTAPRHRRDVGGLNLRVAERAPQAPHIDLEIAVVEEGAGPGGLHQLILADELAGALHQRLEQLEGAAAHFDRLAIEKKKLAARHQPEWPEGKRQFLPTSAALQCLSGRPHSHCQPMAQFPKLSCVTTLLNRAILKKHDCSEQDVAESKALLLLRRCRQRRIYLI